MWSMSTRIAWTCVRSLGPERQPRGDHREEVTLHEVAARVVDERPGHREQLPFMPVDDLSERLDDPQRPHPRILEHRPGRVPETETTDDDIERITGQEGQGETGQLDLRHREQARHEVLLAQDHLVHVDLQRGLQPSPHADLPHGGRAPVELLEVPAHLRAASTAAPYRPHPPGARRVGRAGAASSIVRRSTTGPARR